MSFIKELTVIIPLYNKDKYIARAVNSVLNQSYTNFELIVIDDGSTDNGANEVQKFKDDRIKLIHQNNQGASAARNRGIDEAKGELVAFLDADDAWKRNFLETIIKLRNKYPYAGAFATAYEYKYWNGKVKKAMYNSLSVEFNEGIIDNYFKKCLKDPLICSSSVAIPKNIFLKVGNFDENLSRGEDLDMWFRIALTFPIAFNNDISVSYYKIENKNIYEDPSVKNYKKAFPYKLEKIIDEFNKINTDKYFKKYIDKQFIKISKKFILNGNNKKAKELLNKFFYNKYSNKNWIKFYLLSMLPYNFIKIIKNLKDKINLRILSDL